MLLSSLLKLYKTSDGGRIQIEREGHTWTIDSVKEEEITLAAGATTSLSVTEGIVIFSSSSFKITVVHDTTFEASGDLVVNIDKLFILMGSINLTISNPGSSSIELKAFLFD